MQDLARFHQTQSDSFGKKLFTLFVFGTTTMALLVSVSYLLMATKDSKAMAIISPLASPIQQTYASIREAISPDLASTIQTTLRGADGEYGIVVKNLKTGETYLQNADESFVSASLYKLWLMGTAYTQFENGTIKPTDYLSQDAGNLNNMFSIASESAGLNSGTVAMTAADAVYKAITVSDNYAALLLTSKVTINEMANFLAATGMTHSTKDVTPHTSPSDIALFYEKLYTKSLVSSTASDEMLDILKKQQINDRIPKYLPSFIQAAHKTGELDGNKHDAGIVYTPRGDYIFVVMSNTSDPAVAAERTAVLSQRVYAYFTKE